MDEGHLHRANQAYRASGLLYVVLIVMLSHFDRRGPIINGERDWSDTTKAFPGAMGWAAGTPGGRGGMILRVTTLDLEGPGSITEAIETKGPRVVVFEVGGIIDLSGRSLQITEPFITIAGQTAPSPGITFIKGGIGIRTHDVVIQHVRIRSGDAGLSKRNGWEVDGIATNGAYNVIVDHCSISWATDENLSASGPRFEGNDVEQWRSNTSHRITFSNNLVAEGLSQSTHSKGEHSKGSLIHDNVTDVAVIRNLYVSNVERNPYFKGGAQGVVANNFIHNPGRRAVHYTLNASEWEGHAYVYGQMTLIGNVLRYGPDTRPGLSLLAFRGAGDLELFVEDNLAIDRSGKAVQIIQVEREDGGKIHMLDKKPQWPDVMEVMPSIDVEAYVLENAGARPWDRDLTDHRIVQEVNKGEGRIIDSQNQVGGYPEVKMTYRKFDPDAWNLHDMTLTSQP